MWQQGRPARAAGPNANHTKSLLLGRAALACDGGATALLTCSLLPKSCCQDVNPAQLLHTIS